MHDALAVAFLVVILALVGVFRAFCQHRVDQTGELVRGGGDGLGAIKASAQAAVVSAERRLAGTQRRCRQTQRLRRPIRRSLAGTREHLAAENPGSRAQPQPTGEMLRVLEPGHVGADLGNDLQRCRCVDAIDARQFDAAHPEQVGGEWVVR